MFNFQGLSTKKTVENFDVKVLAASRIKLSEKAINAIGLTQDKQVFLDKDVTTDKFWIAAVDEGGKKITKTNTFGHKVLNQALGEGTEWEIDLLGAQEHNGVSYFPLTLSKVETAPKATEENDTEANDVEANDAGMTKVDLNQESPEMESAEEVQPTSEFAG